MEQRGDCGTSTKTEHLKGINLGLSQPRVFVLSCHMDTNILLEFVCFQHDPASFRPGGVAPLYQGWGPAKLWERRLILSSPVAASDTQAGGCIWALENHPNLQTEMKTEIETVQAKSMCFHKAETSSRSSRPSGRRGKAEPPKCLIGGLWSELGAVIAARPPPQPSVRLGAEVHLFIFFQDERFVSKTYTRGHVGRAVASPSQQRTCLPCVAGAAKRASTYPSPRVSQRRETFFHLVVQRQSLTYHVITLHLALWHRKARWNHVGNGSFFEKHALLLKGARPSEQGCSYSQPLQGWCENPREALGRFFNAIILSLVCYNAGRSPYSPWAFLHNVRWPRNSEIRQKDLDGKFVPVMRFFLSSVFLRDRQRPLDG